MVRRGAEPRVGSGAGWGRGRDPSPPAGNRLLPDLGGLSTGWESGGGRPVRSRALPPSPGGAPHSGPYCAALGCLWVSEQSVMPKEMETLDLLLHET